MMIVLAGYMPKIEVGAASGADAIVAVALAEEGYTEGANNDNKYGAYFGNNNVAWCAYFISWCARQAGIPESVIKTNAWAGSMGSSKGTGNFGAPYYPKGSITPKKGDIVYYGWGSSTSQHVEIVVSTTSSTITSIGGNTGGGTRVYIHSGYSFTSSDIVGYERPNYSGEYIPPSNDDELGIPYPRPSGNPNLKSGSSGSGVSWLQTALNKANNAGLDVDGQFGPATKQAVINFQNANGLAVDGVAGPATINKLVEVIKGKNNISLTIDIWLSSSKMGSETTAFKTYDWYYLCYKIYDKNSSKLLSEVTNNYKNYSITEVICNPDGSIFHSYTYDNSDNNWIGFKPSNAGTYTYKIILKIGDKESSTEKEFVVSDHTHSYGSWTTIKSATCTSDGTKTRTCSICGATETETIFKTGHSWGSWTTTKSPTCTADGSKKRTCSICGATETAVISATGHNFVDKVVELSDTEKYTLHECSVCGYSYMGDYIQDEEYINLRVEKVTANAGNEVVVNVYADAINYDEIESLEFGIEYDKTHLALIDMAVPDVCGLVDAEISMSVENGTFVAFSDYSKGDVKIKIHPDDPILELHFKVDDKATGTFPIEIIGCRRDLPVCLQHYYPSPYWFYKYLTPVIENGSITIEKHTHSYGSWTTINPATCTEDGLMTRKCSICGAEEEAPIIAGHKYVSVMIQPTYTEKGYTLHICSLCNDSYMDNYVEKLCIEKGDANLDYNVTIADVVSLKQQLTKSRVFTAEQLEAADINSDGKINVFDWIILKRRIVYNN